MTRRTVLFVVAYPARFNGAQKSLLFLLRELPDQSIDPVVLFTGDGICVDEYTSAGLQVRVLDLPSEAREYGKRWLSGSLAIRLVRLARVYPTVLRRSLRELAAVRPALVHCNEPRALFVVGVAARLRGLPVVLHLRGSPDPYPRLLRLLLELVPSRIVAVGPSIRGELGPIGRTKATVIYNPIPLPDAQGSTAPKQVVLTLASITPHKGHHHLVEAARLLRERRDGDQPVFRIRGQVLDPAYEEELRRRIAEYGLDNVDLQPWTPNVTGELAEAAAVVSTSVEQETLRIGGNEVRVANAEGTPRQLLEALAACVPVVATRLPGTADVIKDGRTGFLIAPGSPQELADAIERVLDRPDEARRLAAAGRELVAQRHSPAESASRTASLYDELAP